MSTCSDANRLLIAEVMLMKGCPVQACSSNKPRASPLGADPPGVSWHTTDRLRPSCYSNSYCKKAKFILAPQCDEVHWPCSSRHDSTNLAALLCKAVKRLPNNKVRLQDTISYV